MTPAVVIRPRADADLQEIYAYLHPRSATAADRFLVAVATDLDRLAEMPGLGAPRTIHNPALSQLRSWPIGGYRNYIVFYLPTPDGIEVVRVIHAARDPNRLLEQPDE